MDMLCALRVTAPSGTSTRNKVSASKFVYSWEITQLKHINCNEQLMGIRPCPLHKHLKSSSILNKAERMWKMILALYN
jgi:hypothetical protein